jgi:hypothetical protein
VKITLENSGEDQAQNLWNRMARRGLAGSLRLISVWRGERFVFRQSSNSHAIFTKNRWIESMIGSV